MVAIGYGAEKLAFAPDEQDRFSLLQLLAVIVRLDHDIMMLTMMILNASACGRTGIGAAGHDDGMAADQMLDGNGGAVVAWQQRGQRACCQAGRWQRQRSGDRARV